MTPYDPARNLQSCIDQFGRLSMRHAPSTPRHDATADRLNRAEADAVARRWGAVHDHLNGCVADLRMFEDYKGVSAEIAIGRAMMLLHAAHGYADECETLDAMAASNVVQLPVRSRTVLRVVTGLPTESLQ